MIAMTLGLLMIGAAAMLMLSNRSTFLAVDTSSRIQENGRFALSILADNIRMAGFYDPVTSGPSNFMFNGTCGTFNPCTANGAGTASDRIAVMFNPPGDNERDCTGAATDDSAAEANNTFANVFYLVTGANGVNSLVCRGYNTSTGAWNAAAQPIIDGIDAMQLQYGVLDTDQVESYVSADRVTNWGEVRSVRISLLVSDGAPTGSAEQETRSYDMADAGTLTFTDKYQRRLFSTTVVINNAFNAF